MEKYKNNTEDKIPEISPQKIDHQDSVNEDFGSDSENYEINQIIHEIVEKYQPKYLSRGGESLVYEIPNHPNVVVKVNIASIKKIVEWNLANNHQIDSFSLEINTFAEIYLKQERDCFQRLKRYFGLDHIPNQRQSIIKIPVNEKILELVFGEEPPKEIPELFSLITIQEKIPELLDSGHLDFTSGYAEDFEVEADIYNKVTRRLSFNSDELNEMAKDEFLSIQPNDSLKDVLIKSQNDEDFKNAVCDFITRAVKYTNETGEILDILGESNIIFSKKNQKWSYKMADVFMGINSPDNIKKAREILLKLQIDDHLNSQERTILLNVLNYIRTINGFVDFFGLEERVNIIDSEKILNKEIDFFKILKSNKIE